MTLKSNSKVFLTKVNLTYQGEKRNAAIYEDKTAILDSGEMIQIPDDKFEAILAKLKRAEAQARSEIRAAAIRDAERKRQWAKQAQRAAEAKEADSEDSSGDSDEPLTRYPESDAFITKKRVLKIIASTLVYALVVSSTLFGAKYLIDNHLTRVSVAQFSTSVAKDQLITPDNLKQLKMPESVYRELTENAPGEVVLWTDAQSLVGQYAAMDAIRGQYVTTDYVTATMTENLWKAAMSSDQKTFNLDFDHFAIDEIFPGSHISVKAVVSVPKADGKGSRIENMSVSGAAAMNRAEAEAAAKAEDKTEKEEKDAAPAAVAKPDPAPAASDEDESASQEDDNGSESETRTDTVEPDTAAPTDADSFADVVVVDLKNTYNESLFDIYLRLASMTTEDRRAYLQDRAKSSNAKEYMTSLTPTVMVLALDDTQYNDITIVKNMNNASLEYAGIPSTSYDSTEEQNSLLMKFKEVQRDISEIFSAARSGSLR